MQIALDGPAAAGKSTVAKLIAERMGMVYIDTGAMYRAVALYFVRKGMKSISSADTEKIVSELPNINVSISNDDGMQVVYLNGEDVNGLIRTDEVGSAASAVSAIPQVRRMLVKQQQELASKQDVVMDGRDIGTVVLPNADLKVFMTADSRERAKRRYEELVKKGSSCTMQDVIDAIAIRDNNDSTRACSPLKRADDAVLLITTTMTADEAADKIISMIPAGLRAINRSGI